MQLRLHRPRSRGDADLKGAPRVSFKSTWRYSYSLSTTTSTTTPTPLHQKFTTTPTYLHNGIHTGPLTFLLLRQSSNQPGKKPHSVFVCSLILFFFLCWVWILSSIVSIRKRVCVFAGASALTTGGFLVSSFSSSFCDRVWS